MERGWPNRPKHSTSMSKSVREELHLTFVNEDEDLMLENSVHIYNTEIGIHSGNG